MLGKTQDLYMLHVLLICENKIAGQGFVWIWYHICKYYFLTSYLGYVCPRDAPTLYGKEN